MKILGIILGILMCIGGVYCIAMPALTFGSLSTIFGIILIESAIAYFILWSEIKKRGGKSGLLFLNAILSLLLGISLLTNLLTKLVVENLILTIIAMYMIINGVVQIIDAVNTKKESKHWILSLIGGILIVFGGIFSIANPIVLELAIGINMAINIFVVGAGLIMVSLAYKK